MHLLHILNEKKKKLCNLIIKILFAAPPLPQSVSLARATAPVVFIVVRGRQVARPQVFVVHVSAAVAAVSGEARETEVGGRFAVFC
jgi:hypothetical protein